MKQYSLGLIGCGDYLRINLNAIKNSKRVTVAGLFDTDRSRAESISKETGGQVHDDASAVIQDPEVDIVVLFVPPWVRPSLVSEVAAAGKAILTTKPIAPNTDDCDAMIDAVSKARVACGVLYNRSESLVVRALKEIFDSGEIGSLALFRQDWLHHYPKWNNWATDPKKNGGPFMDAMIHNLNTARYLFGRPVVRSTFFTDNVAHPNLACADTESMKLDFDGGGTANLFITWAGDLAVYSEEGNQREHIDIFYCVTDKGWHITLDESGGETKIAASRLGKKKSWSLKPFENTVFDDFAIHLAGEAAWPDRLPNLVEAAQDISLMRCSEAVVGKTLSLVK